MNKVFLCGRLTKDPEIKIGSSGVTVARYSLAVDRYKDSADFISIIAFNKQAEFCEKYLKKGMKILIEGKILTGSYTNKDNVKIYTTDIIVDRHEFVEKKGEQQEQTPNDDFMSIPDGIEDGLPFR
jgi:single-strand DNA-binding protein